MSSATRRRARRQRPRFAGASTQDSADSADDSQPSHPSSMVRSSSFDGNTFADRKKRPANDDIDREDADEEEDNAEIAKRLKRRNSSVVQDQRTDGSSDVVEPKMSHSTLKSDAQTKMEAIAEESCFQEEDEPTTESIKMSFMDEFCMYLAQNLLGRYDAPSVALDNGDDNRSFCLYWRTPVSPSFKTNEAEVVFLDVTFRFGSTLDSRKGDKNDDDSETDEETQPQYEEGIRSFRKEPTSPQPQIQLQFGILLKCQHSNTKDCFYCQTKNPLELSELKIHATQLGIDVDASEPQGLALLMSNALKNIGASPGTKASSCTQRRTGLEIHFLDNPSNNSSSSTRLELGLHYPDFHETAKLCQFQVPYSDQIRHKDGYIGPLALAMLMQNLAAADRLASSGSKEDKTSGQTPPLEHSIQQWWKSASAPASVSAVPCDGEDPTTENEASGVKMTNAAPLSKLLRSHSKCRATATADYPASSTSESKRTPPQRERKVGRKTSITQNSQSIEEHHREPITSTQLSQVHDANSNKTPSPQLCTNVPLKRPTPPARKRRGRRKLTFAGRSAG